MSGVVKFMATRAAEKSGKSWVVTYKVLSVYWAETLRLFVENSKEDGDCNVVTACVRLPGLGRLFCSEGPYKKRDKTNKTQYDKDKED